MRKLITALVATFTILLAGSFVGNAEAAPRPMFPLTKSYTPTEKVAYYHRYARRHYYAVAITAMATATDPITAMATTDPTMATAIDAATVGATRHWQSALRLAEARQSCEREAGLLCIALRMTAQTSAHPPGVQECGRVRSANPTPLADGKFSQTICRSLSFSQRLTLACTRSIGRHTRNFVLAF